MHVSAVSRLRRALLGDEQWRVKVIEPYQMLGEIDPELREALGADVIPVQPRTTLFGFENKEWKPWRLFDGTEVLVPGDFQVDSTPEGDWLIYPQGDRSAPPSGRMPHGGLFFDSIVRQPPLDEARLDPCDNFEEFALFGPEDVAHWKRLAERLDAEGDWGAVLTVPGAGFGDIALVPAPWMKRPRGIRAIDEWYISTAARPQYVRAVFERQCEIAERNLETLIGIFGDRIDAAFVTGTDFGSQRGPFISPDSYRSLFKPYHRRINQLIHRMSNWKTFIHSCGSVYQLIPDFIEAGFDILNPVQCSAAEMEPRRLKREFGRDIVFWGGGIDTQKTLPFGTPEEIYRQTRERIEILGEGGGFVFDAIHNVQGDTPLENLMAMWRAIRDAQ